MNETETNAMSRRQIVGGAGAGLAVAAAVAHTAQAQPTLVTAQPLQDPTTKYPEAALPTSSRSPGRASRARWTPRPTMARRAIAGRAGWPGRKALITGGDSGMGRAAAIAYAREGADVAINYFPTEEPDAREVIALIKQAGRNGVAIPGDLRDEAFCTQPGGRRGAGPGRAGHRGQQCRAAAGARLDPRHHDRSSSTGR